MTAPKIYGTAPIDLGLIDLDPKEMLFWLYCPIKLANSHNMHVPANLAQFMPIVGAVIADVEPWRLHRDYIYLTAKNVWTTPDNTAQRPGWHCDGFMTDDLNYIWQDREPTLFWEPGYGVALTQDHGVSMEEMRQLTERYPEYNRTYPLKHLLRLDQTVIHRVADFAGAGMRAFVKVSVSQHPFNLVGNSINHHLVPDWHYAHRSAERNPEVARQDDKAS